MGNINLGRVIAGGLVAGLVANVFDGVLNAVVLADRWSFVQQQMGHSAQFSVNQVILFNVLGFVTGILGVWVYSAVRPRFGAGPRTAILTGLLVWALFNAIPNLYMVTTAVLPRGLMGITILVGIVEYPVAMLAGAALYKESEARARQAANAG